MKTFSGALLIAVSCIMTVILKLGQAAMQTFDHNNYIGFAPPYMKVEIAWMAILTCFVIGLFLILIGNEGLLNRFKMILNKIDLLKTSLIIFVISLLGLSFVFRGTQVFILRLSIIGFLISFVLIGIGIFKRIKAGKQKHNRPLN